MADDDKKPAGRPTRKRPARKPAVSAQAAAAEPQAAPGRAEDTAATGADVGAGALPSVTVTAAVDDAATDRQILDAIDLVQSIHRLGHLDVHYVARTVSYVMDGGCAARVMAVYASRLDRFIAEDPMVPGDANMNNLWVTLSVDQVLGMSWMPGIPPVGPRTMTVDPPPPAPQ